MQNANNENVIKQYAAMLIAVLMIISMIAVYLFPWAVPIFWDMPENTVLPYYGILLAVEMAPMSFLVKASLMEAANKNKKGE
jgi:hypothetical protein